MSTLLLEFFNLIADYGRLGSRFRLRRRLSASEHALAALELQGRFSVTFYASPFATRREDPRLQKAHCDGALEADRHLARTGLAACIAHFIRVRGVATSAGGIGIGPIVRDGDNARSVTVNINVARGRSAPREVYRVSPLDFVASRI